MSKIYEDLQLAEEYMQHAVAKMNNLQGGRMQNGRLYVRRLADQKRAVSLLLKLRHLKESVKSHDA